MISIEAEGFTAKEAIEAGLIEAIKRGETKIEGSYKITEDGYLVFKQRNFTFTDKSGNLRVGKFFDDYELLFFFKNFSSITKFGESTPQGIKFVDNLIVKQD